MKVPLKQARIIQAADAVAYLPLYVAEDLELKLDRGRKKPALNWSVAFGEPARSPPEEYVNHIAADTHRGGDLGCLHAIAHAWKRDQQPLIGICDPVEIAKLGYETDLAIVGGFIRRACFWCLTDQASKANDLGSLDIDSLFIHDAGFSTGHAIGEKIADELRQQIDVVPGSFELLVDGAVWQKRAFPQRKLAAISASILSCVIAKNRGELRVAFPLHSVERYSEFLSTAIVVPRPCLEDEEFRDALTLLVLALQEGVNYLEKSETQGILKLVELANNDGRFAQERIIDSAEVVDSKVVPLRSGNVAALYANLAMVDASDAKDIYKYLIEADLYARAGRIVGKEWDNAWRTRANNGPLPLARFYDNRIVDQASKARIVGGGPVQPTRGRLFLTLSIIAVLVIIVIGLQLGGGVVLRGALLMIVALGALALLVEFRLAIDRGLHWVVRDVWLRKIVVIVALIIGAGLVVVEIMSIFAALFVLVNEESLNTEFVSGAPPWFASFWLAWAPKLSHEWHLVIVACSTLLGLVWACAGLTPFGRRARQLFGLLGREHPRRES